MVTLIASYNSALTAEPNKYNFDGTAFFFCIKENFG
jgi:hypothetical protein